MKVLVTGAAGFLGTGVVGALVQRGHEVSAMVRPATGSASATAEDALRSAGVAEIVDADLRTSPHLSDALRTVDAVVHLAATVKGSDQARFAGTVVGTERLLAALAGSGVRRLVLVSSYSVYDWSAARRALTEETPVTQWPYDRDSYAVAKAWQERIVRAALEPLPVELVVLRPGFIWGPGHTEISGAGVGLPRGMVVIGPRSQLPLTFVDNCAECVALAAEVPDAAGQTFNVVDDETVTAWRYAGEYLRSSGGGPRIPVPYWMARAGVQAVSATSKRLFRYGGRLPGLLVPVRFEARFRPLHHDARKARQVLGWRPVVDLDTALERTFGGVQSGPNGQSGPNDQSVQR
jgi:2-alkyl-3-oxoalkanoate reductase